MGITKLKELGIMIDCSRNAVVNLPALKQLIMLCSDFKYDYVGLYTEDTIEVEGEPYFGYQRGRLSVEEIREADEYAHELGLELRPYIQTLAHINQIVDYADYINCIDVNDILLVDDKRTEKLLDNILKTISEAYSSKTVNIGMDEAHMLGLGKYLELHGYQDRVGIMLKHLEKVVSLCKKHGLKPQMWSDMFFRLLSGGEYGAEDSKEAEKLSEKLSEKVKIPEGLELVYWDYYSTDENHFKKIIAQHKAITSNLSFAGGAWRWMGFTPYNSYSILSTRASVRACLQMDIDSYVMTLWGDDGTECSMYAVLPALYEAALSGGRIHKENTLESFKSLTGYTMEEFMLLDIADPGCMDDKKNNLSKILLFNDPLLGIFDSLVPENAREYFSEAAQKLKDVIKNENRKYDYLFEVQQRLCDVLACKADLGIRMRDAYKNKDIDELTAIREEIPGIVDRLDAFYRSFRKQWLKENKSFGFEVQTIRIGGLKQRLLDIEQLLEAYLSGTVKVIEELEGEALPVGYALHGASDAEPEYNRYEKLVTTARLTW